MIEKVYFKALDGVELAGLLHHNDKKDSVIISVHGFSGNCLTKRDDIIAKKSIQNGIAYFTFNNRGHDIISNMNIYINGEKKKYVAGAMYEDILDSYYDICAAIREMLQSGYKNIYLQGHSLGCTKIIYTYNRLKEENNDLLNCIKSVILLSLVDIIGYQIYTLKENCNEYLNYATEQEKNGNLYSPMPQKGLDFPMCVKTYLRYFRDNEKINFSRYNEDKYDFKEINNIEVPLFIRYGNVNEMIIQDASVLVQFMKNKIKNNKLSIDYIDGANHNYYDREEVLSNQIVKFLEVN